MSSTTTPFASMTGTVVTTALVNLRSGAPSRSATIARKVAAGTTLSVTGIMLGETVAGNPNWYLTADGLYLWSGGASALQTTGGTDARLSSVKQTPRVVDISHGDGVASFKVAREAGLLAVIHKATTGATGRDDAYKARRVMARDAGLLWGAYHWGTAAPVEDQVANFLDWAAPDADTLVAVDFETTAGNQMTVDGLKAFCSLIDAKLGRRPVIYAGGYLKDQLGRTADPILGQHRLWLAQYGPKPVPQASWTDFWLWQYTDGIDGPQDCCKTVAGIPGDSKGRLDCDFFAGTDSELKDQWTK
jgi:hypothetical protein